MTPTLRLLIVDDSRLVRTAMSRLFSEDHEVTTADDAAGALAALGSGTCDLICLDHDLAVGGECHEDNGCGVLEKIRESHAVPVVLISGRKPDCVEQLLESGRIEAFLEKQSDPTAVYDAVMRVVSSLDPSD